MNEDIRERNLCLRRDAHATREGESVSLLRVIPPHPALVAMSDEEQRGKKRSKKHKKRKSKKHRRIKSPTLETSRFRIVNQEHQFKWGLSDLMVEYANGHLNILIQEKRSNVVNSKVHSSPIKLTRSKTNG